jgi:hypothetical protein
LPGIAPDEASTTVVLKIKGTPDIADFKLSTDPAGALTLDPKSVQTVKVTIDPSGRFNGTVKFSAWVFPDGMSASFNPDSVVRSGTITMTLNGADHAKPGLYGMTIAAESGSLKDSAILNLTLLNAAGNNVAAITSSGHAVETGGFDMNDYTYDAAVLGDSATFDGTIMKLGPPGEMDAWSQTTVPLSGHGTTLKILAAAANGEQTAQKFTVHYTDGTSQSFSRDLSDWCNPGDYQGEAKVVTADHRLGSEGAVTGPGTYVYGYKFPLDESKTPQSLTLPDNRNVVVLSVSVVGQ